MNPGRRDVEDPLRLQPGEYGRCGPLRSWYAKTPTGDLADLSRHNVVEHEDGTITVTPAISLTSWEYGVKREWRGAIEGGLWRRL